MKPFFTYSAAADASERVAPTRAARDAAMNGSSRHRAPRRDCRFRNWCADLSPTGRAPARRSGSGGPSRYRFLRPRSLALAASRFCSSISYMRAFSMFIAVARLPVLASGRFWQATMMPVGIWVMRMANSVLFTCWPPAPEARKVSTFKSAGLISIWIVVVDHGIDPDARRSWYGGGAAESKGEMRTRRCTPIRFSASHRRWRR